jgi:uncharacterized protein YndB with AHSA1/START domain
MAQENGYLVIADISGYTAFLTQVELEHAEGIMKGLFDTLVKEMKSPLVISKLEGDAIFAYAPEGSFVQGQTLLEAIENIYCAFAMSLESMQLNTDCSCKACELMPTLDLKFVLHHGTYMLSEIGGRQELSGTDVILAHRLLKNNIVETSGYIAYAFLSQACADAMALGELKEGMKTHTENYEHLGEVSGYVYDLHSVWHKERDVRRVYVDPDESWFKVEVEVSAKPSLIWDYLANPQLRRHWLQADGMTAVGADKGRIGIGTDYHCAHGDLTIIQTVVDWKPFDYMTLDVSFSKDQRFRLTTRLTATDGVTLVSWYFFKLGGSNFINTFLTKRKTSKMQGMLSDSFSQGSKLLREMVEKGMAGGKVSN